MTQRRVHENGHDKRYYDAGNVQKQAQIAPSLELWIVKNRLGHAELAANLLSFYVQSAINLRQILRLEGDNCVF